MSLRYYILDGTTPVPVSDILEWGRKFEEDNQVVAYTELGDVNVYTVFLGIDHSHSSNGAPILFETMILGGARDEEQERYSTWEQALAGHNRIVAKLKGER